MTKVLYIMGAQRSGTTILGNILGSGDQALHVGELNYLHEPNNPSPNCGCGLSYGSCPIWSSIPSELKWSFHQRSAEARAATRLDKNLPIRQTRAWKRQHRANTYAGMTADLYHAIAKASGAQVVIDSSKFPGGALGALTGSGIDAYFLHVVRDPRAVTYSLSKRQKSHGEGGPLMKRRTVTNGTLRWIAANTGSHVIQSAVPNGRYLRVRYEDIMGADRAPRETANAIADWCGIDLSKGPFISEDAVDLTPNHCVMGNPNRFSSGPIELSLDNEFRDGLSAWEVAQVTGMAAPLMARYGYRLTTS